MSHTVLRLNTSPRGAGSQSNQGVDRILKTMPGADIILRDLTASPPTLVNDTIIGGYFTPPDDRTMDQRKAIAPSDRAVEELEQADTIVIGLPIYNFSVPAAFKGWFDMVARAGRTFRYTENGPIGLLNNKRVIVVVA